MSQACSSIKTVESNGSLDYLHQGATQWRDIPEQPISYAPREETIFLVGGLTLFQNHLIQDALQSIGSNFVALPNADFESFQRGKAFGNRGQCNPTYFTVGNLIKYLQNLRDHEGISTEEIVRRYVYMTAGGCGPCRFGMYITEYKKALRDAGFDGFRIRSFEHDKGIFQEEAEAEDIINFTPKFLFILVKAILLGDLLNIVGYRMRPYEVEQGSTDAALDQCRAMLSEAFKKHRMITLALYRCRKLLEAVTLDRLQPKPKVMVMGEFWAALTEGDGNYNLYRFLEAEGAECIPQPVLNRLMLSIWEAEYDLTQVEHLPTQQGKRIDFSHAKSRLMIRLAKYAVKGYFGLYAKAIGLTNYEIPSMEKLADLARDYYTLECDGGEGYLEVAHLIESVKDKLAHLVISVKPFGCMPSSAVSDGVQSLVTSHYPEANFLSIETSGEGAANFYSRVQMALFKAKQSAKEEYATLKKPIVVSDQVHHYSYIPKSDKIGTAAKIIDDLTN